MTDAFNNYMFYTWLMHKKNSAKTVTVEMMMMMRLFVESCRMVLLRFHFFNHMRLAAQGAIELGLRTDFQVSSFMAS